MANQFPGDFALKEVKLFFEANHPKGEFVIVVEGTKKQIYEMGKNS